MKSGYFILSVLALTFFLTGCTNRFETYEPYSTFDDRMAAADKGKPVAPDDQMPPASDDQYASAGDQGFTNDDQASESTRASSQSSSGSGQSDVEVPFSSSRSPVKHAMNIGADQ